MTNRPTTNGSTANGDGALTPSSALGNSLPNSAVSDVARSDVAPLGNGALGNGALNGRVVPGRRASPRSGSDSLVRLSSVTCAYGPEPVLEDVDFEVDAGDFVGIVGPSGSGKSTLLRAISGSIEPVRGTVDTTGVRFGFVPQLETVNWDFPVTVAQCVLMARTRPLRRFWSTRSERAAEREQLHTVLDRLGIGEFADRHIRALSGGQQQRMFLARALMTDADVLLLDEPTSGLDVRTRHEVLHLLDELRKSGMAVVITTHDLNGIAAHLPRVVCLNRVVVGAGTPAQVLTSENLERTYGSPMEVLQHAGMPVVVDASPDLRVVAGG